MGRRLTQMNADLYWKDDNELFEIARRELYTAVVGDIMDKLDLQRQFLPPQIQPLAADMVAVGRAMTVLEADISDDSGSDTVQSKPFGLMLEALDGLRSGEIYVCTGASPTYALWGELMSMRAMKLGSAGAVLNGYSRDTRGILKLGFPTFSWGRYAQDQAPRGKVVDFRIPVDIAGTRVESGDIIFGDLDGVCVVPKGAEQEVFAKAIEKARGEKTVGKALQAGLSAGEAFAKYGIL